DLGHQGAADLALIPGGCPRLIDLLVAGTGVLPEVLGDEPRLALIAAPAGRPLAPATLFAPGASPGLRPGLLLGLFRQVAGQPQLGPHLGHQGVADRALEPRRLPSLVHGPGVGLRMVVEVLLDEARLAPVASRSSSRHVWSSRREVARSFPQ